MEDTVQSDLNENIHVFKKCFSKQKNYYLLRNMASQCTCYFVESLPSMKRAHCAQTTAGPKRLAGDP